jgi:hypothetical protein
LHGDVVVATGDVGETGGGVDAAVVVVEGGPTFELEARKRERY